MLYGSYQFLDQDKEIMMVRIHEEEGPINNHQYRPYTWTATCISRRNSTVVTIVGTYRAPTFGESKTICRLLATLGKTDIYWQRSTGKVSHVNLRRFRK